MDNMKTRLFGKSRIDLFFRIVMMLEFGFVAYANLFRIPITMDNDAAKLFTHAIEMWNSKHIFIPAWVNETMLELDTALLFAVPIFAITGDIYISFGLSNLIILLAYYFFVSGLLERMGQPVYIRSIACILLTIPYSFGQLLYFNMMFFSGGFYGIKILVPFMLIWLITTKESDRKPSFWIIAAFTTVLTFICAVSTGPYILVAAILPITGCYIWLTAGGMRCLKDLFSKWLISVSSIILYAQFITSVIGIIVTEIMQVDSSGSKIYLLDYKDFFSNLGYILSNYFDLFGSFSDDGAIALSISGISSFSHFALAVLTLVAILSIVLIHFKKLGNVKSIEHNKHPLYYLLVLFVWNLGMLFICLVEQNCRYLLIVIVPMLPLTAVFYDQTISKVEGVVSRNILQILVSGFIILVALLSDYTVMINETKPLFAHDNSKYAKVADMLAVYPEKQVFLFNDMGWDEFLRAYDYKSGREYLDYETKDGGVVVHDYYRDRTDASYFDQDHLLIIDEYFATIDDMPAYLKNCYTEVDSYQNIHIYRGNVNRMDGVGGYTYNEYSVDYCYTPGYVVEYGDIADDGSLLAEGNGENCISSPWLPGTLGDVTIKVDYECVSGDKELGEVQIWDCDMGKLIESRPLQAGEKEVVFEDLDPAGSNIVVQIVVNKDAVVKIKRFTYER